MNSYIVYPEYEVDSKVAVTLTKEEISLLIEALLFSSSVNIGADWNSEDYQKMLAVAKSLREKIQTESKFKNIWFCKEESYEDQFTEEILKHFGNDLQECNFDDV